LPHGLEEVGGTRHVFHVWKRLEDFHHLAHERPSLGIPAKASMGQLGCFLSAFDGEVSLQTGVYKPIETPSFSKIRACPFDQIVLPVWSVLVH
jgi:hypothetical protein